MSDRIAVMNKGDVLQVGKPDEIYEQPTDKFVADFIGESNFLKGTVVEVEGKAVGVSIAGVGTVRIISDTPVVIGQAVDIAIRPEKSSINALLEKGNNLKGHVEEVIYIGTDTHYGVKFADTQKVRVREQNTTRAQKTLAVVGDEVSISFTLEAALVLQER